MAAACAALLLIVSLVQVPDRDLAAAAPASPDIVKITPVAVTGPGGSSIPDPAALFDRSTRTELSADQATTLTVELGRARELAQLKVFGPAPYLLTVKAAKGELWETVDGFKELDLRHLPEQWAGFTLPAPVTTQRVQLVLQPKQGSKATGLKELELWAKGRRVSTKSPGDLLTRAQEKLPPENVHLITAAPAEAALGGDGGAGQAQFRADLPVAPTHIKRAWLVYELTGAGHWIGVKRAVNGQPSLGPLHPLAGTAWSVQMERLGPETLVRGTNRIDFLWGADAPSYRVRNIRLLVETEDGGNFVAAVEGLPYSDVNTPSAVRDGDLNTGWSPYPSGAARGEAHVLTLLFDKPTQLDGVWLSLINGLKGKIDLEVREGANWIKGAGSVAGTTLSAGHNLLLLKSSTPVDGLRLIFHHGEGSTAAITEVAPIGSGVGWTHGKDIAVTYPTAGEYFEDTALLRGYLTLPDNGSGPARVLVAGKTVAMAGDGAFEAAVTRAEAGAAGADAPWTVTIEAVYPDGERLTKTVTLTQYQEKLTWRPVAAVPDAGSLDGAPYSLEHDEGALDLDGDAMDEPPATLTITKLGAEDLPPLDPGMTNVTRGPRAGYRFGPHGKRFKKPIRVSLPYDKGKLPEGMTEADIRTYYFDEATGHWRALERVEVDRARQRITSHTDHFTDMINATLVVPEHPEAVSFNPTQIKDIQAADPGAKINLIEPPQAGPMGDARLSYPIEIPPGRRGMQPQLAVQYNSGGGNGWLGLGWDLSLPAITIETRWGVPRYDATYETESYLLAGEQLTPLAHRDAPKPRSKGTVSHNGETVKIFHTRVEGQFRKIIRHGGNPKSYWWEVIDKDGTRHFYGGTPAGQDAEAVLGSEQGVFRWLLTQTLDPYGNTVNYQYVRVCHTGTGGGHNPTGGDTCQSENGEGIVPGYQLYPASIDYTGYNGASGAYRVTFTRDRELGEAPRPDVIIDARGGFKQVTADRLRRISVHYNDALVRKYELQYELGTFDKTRLKALVQYGADGTKFNQHAFAYYDDLPTVNDGYRGFASEVQNVDAGDDKLYDKTLLGTFRETLLGGGLGRNQGFNGFVGVGPVGHGLEMAAGRSHSSNSSESESKVALIDIDGDGRPDKVFRAGGGIKYRKNETQPGSEVLVFSAEVYDVPGLTRLPRSRSDTTTRGGEFYAGAAMGHAQKSTTTTTERSYFADVNGDGLVDFVADNGVVYFCLKDNATGGMRFEPSSANTPNPIGGGVLAAEDLLAGLADEEEQLRAQNPLLDVVRRWVAPYDGTVRIEGTVQLHDYLSDPTLEEWEKQARADYKTADGVRVAIQKNDHELWAARLPAADPADPAAYAAAHAVHTLQALNNIAGKPASVTSIPVKRGDKLYFRVQSVDDGSYDRVNWSPRIVYVDGAGVVKEHPDVNNLNVYRYDTREDTVFAGQPVKHVAPYTGTLHFQGTLRKPDPTTDDVTFSITVYDVVDQGNGTFIEVPRGAGSTYRRTIAWNEVGEIALSADVHVEETDKVELRFLIDSPIDLNALAWDGTPELYYTEAYKEAAALKKVPQPQDDDTPPDEIELPTNADDYKLDEKDFEDAGSIERHAVETQRNGEYILRLPVTYDMDMYPGDSLNGELQTPWIAPKDGVVYVAPRVTLKQYLVPGTEDRYEARAPDGDIVFTAKRRGELIGKGTIQVRDRRVVADTQGLGALVAVPVRQGDEIFFDFSVRDRTLAQEIETTSLYQTYSSNGAWRVPLTDTLTVRPRYKGGFIPEDEAEQGTTEQDPAPLQQAVFVVRRGAELLVRQLLTTPTFNTDNLDFPIAVNADDELAFDLVAIGHLSLSDRSVWGSYHTDSTWVAPQGGQLTVKPQLAFGAGAPPGTVTLIVWCNGTQLTERSYLVRDGQVLGEPLAVAVQPGQTLQFDYVTGTPELASRLLEPAHVQLTYPDAAAQTTVAARDFHIAMPNGHAILWIGGPSATLHYADPDPLFGNAYRGWAQAGYNGNDEWAEQPIAATRLKLSEIESDYKDFSKPVTAYLAVPMPERARWESADPDWGLAGAYMKSTRLGRKFIDLPKPEAFAPRAGITLRVPRQSRAASHGVGGGYFISANYTRSETASQLDIIDLNGDRYPDLMGGGKVQFTLPDGSLGETLPGANPDEPHAGLDAAARTTKNTDLAFGFGASVAIPRTDSKAKTENADSKAVHPSLVFNASVSASFGDNYGLTELLDINGDGLPDRVGWDKSDNLVVRLNLGYGFADPELWGQGPAINEGTSESVALGIGGGWSTPAQTFSGGLNLSVGHNDVARQLLDMNGDGLLDYVRVVGGAIKVAFNRGGGFGGALAWDGAHQTLASIGELTTDNGYGNKTTPFAASATLSDGTSTSVTGSANFSVAIPVGVPPVFDLVFKTGGSIGQTVSQPTVGFRDVNGDGLPDSIRSPRDSKLEAALNQTGRTNLLKRIERPLGAVITLDYARRGNTYPQPHSQWALARVTVHDGHAGDGADVRATAYAYAGGYYDRREREFYGYATVTERQLDTAHDDAVTRTLTRTYRTDSFYTKGLLARELTADGADKPYLETVNTYRLLDAATGQEFTNPTSTNPASLTARVFPALVRTERRFYEGADDPVKTTHVTYAYDAWGNVSGYLDAGEPDTREDNVYAEIVYTGTDPAHAACGERHIVGLPTAITVRPAPGRGPVLRERHGTYNCTTGALTHLRRRVEDPGARRGTAWAESDFGYDAYGNLERLTGPLDANGKRHVLVFGYDAVVDTYPERIETQEEGHTKYHSTARYNYRFGVPEETIDLNGNPLTQQYDAFGRLIEVRGPYEQAAGSPPTLHFAYHPEAATPYARTQHHDRDAEGHAKDPIETLLFVDGLKRIVQTKKDITRYVPGAAQGEAAMSVSGRVVFDALGRVVEQYYPTWEAKGANTAFSGSTATESPTKTAYDVLDRPLTVTLPDESVTRHTYGFGAVDGPVQFVTTTLDAEGNKREVYRDVRGAITAVREFNPKGGQPELTTRYRYDRLGQIEAVTDAAGHVTAVGYDTLGRRTRLRNPDTGLLAWRYDLADNLIARVTPNLRARGQAIQYRYDYNRLIGIDYPTTPEQNVRYVYGDDTPENRAVGRVARITRVEHESGYEERWYGRLGEVVRETKSVHLPQSAWHSGAKHTQGTTQPASYEVFTTRYDYDSFGRLLRLTYPDGETLTYRYDAGGLPESVHGTHKGAPYAYVKRIGYDHFESRVHVALGNGAESTYRYDPTTRRLANLATQSLGQRFQNLGYQYDRVGNVTDLINDVAVPTDGLGGYTKQHFDYDNLARLTYASGLYQGAADRREEYSLVMAYDGIHNITHKTQRHTVTSLTGSGTKHATSYDWAYRYEGAQPHAPTHIGERTFRYDANGNQLGWTHDRNATRRAISWDDADRIQAIEDRGGEYSTYGYDDQGQRVIKQARQNLTVYVNPYFTERNGAIGSKHVFVGSTRLVTKVTGGTNFIRSYDGFTGAKVPPGQTKNGGKGKAAGKGDNGRHLGQTKAREDSGKHLGQAKHAERAQGNRGKGADKPNNGKAQGNAKGAGPDKDGAHPGQGLAHRAERANEVAQNTCKNKHLAPLYCPDAGGGDTPPEDGTDPGEETPGTPPAQELIKVSMGEQLFYYHPDHLGSTGYVTRENGKLHEHIQYFPFGETWIQQGGNTEKSPYLFTAKELDEETGLYYFGARYYDPRTSVWQSPDPILGQYLPMGNKGQDQNLAGMGGVFNPLNLALYTYAHLNPLKVLDPDGRESVDEVNANLEQGNVRSRSVDGTSGWARPVAGYEAPMATADLGVTGIGLVTGAGQLKALAAWAVGKFAARQAAGVAAEAGQAGSAAGRVFTSKDPLVGELATKIDAMYPGHVVDVNVPVRNAAGELVTDADILLQNAVIQVKSGGGKGLTSQLLRTEQATGLPTIGYGPSLKPSVVKGAQEAGCLVTTCESTLLQLIKP